jgi:membrane protease YdiL (CAAX protease family)
MRLFTGIRAATWPVLGLTVIAYACALLFVSAVLFQGRISEQLGSLYMATRFLVQASLVAGLFSMVVVGVILFGVRRLKGSDVGWKLPDVWQGAMVTIGFWVAMNVVLAVFVAIKGGVFLNETWTTRGPIAVLGGLIGQLVGNALVEETVFRGFLLPQFYLKGVTVFRHGTALAMALVGSSLLFAVSHVPHRLMVWDLGGSAILWDQAGLFLMGIFLAAVYLVTRNLFVVVGLHALVNEPVPIFAASSEAILYAVWGGLAVLLVVIWWILSIARNGARQDGPGT